MKNCKTNRCKKWIVHFFNSFFFPFFNHNTLGQM